MAECQRFANIIRPALHTYASSAGHDLSLIESLLTITSSTTRGLTCTRFERVTLGGVDMVQGVRAVQID
jgi:hypothetical protein